MVHSVVQPPLIVPEAASVFRNSGVKKSSKRSSSLHFPHLFVFPDEEKEALS
jgi:hypothetical protein